MARSFTRRVLYNRWDGISFFGISRAPSYTQTAVHCALRGNGDFYLFFLYEGGRYLAGADLMRRLSADISLEARPLRRRAAWRGVVGGAGPGRLGLAFLTLDPSVKAGSGDADCRRRAQILGLAARNWFAWPMDCCQSRWANGWNDCCSLEADC